MNLGSASNLPRQLPYQLNGYVSQLQWDDITLNFRRHDTDAIFISCAGEWVCCLCTGFFCIFCCHPFFHNLLVSDKLEQECRRVNTSYFGSNAVFRVNNNLDILMSPEYLPPLLAGATAAVAENYVAPIVPVVMVSPIHQEEEQPPIVLPATGKEDDLRTAEHVVGLDPVPGSQITVTAPSGTMVMLTLPDDVQAGSILTYSY